MAKKRVNELAREHDMPAKEVVARLEAAGIRVKALASPVDEEMARAALTGRPLPQRNGDEEETAKGRSGQPTRPAGPAARQPAAGGRGSQAGRGPADRGPAASAPDAPPADRGAQPDAGAASRPDSTRRPTRSSLQGERAPGAPGGRRRVVIDSQASRRQPGGGPGGPGQGAQRGRQQRGRGGSRRQRRAEFEEQGVQSSATTATPTVQAIRIPSGSTVKDVAEYFDVSVADVIKKLMGLGEMATLTQTLSDEAVGLLAEEFEQQVELVSAAESVAAGPEFEDSDEDLVGRPPVVTIMGHVDHGKTSLLDAIRQTEVAAGEAGGITQHIGAYQVHHGDRVITFLDTPGHEAFTAMRARGAQVTDIAVIVVAADDGVKPQTREAVDHAKAADVPMLVAVNKIDKPGAQPDRVRTEMTGLGLQPEEWGGETLFVDVSAKTRDGLDDLLDSLGLMADVEELRANPKTAASGVVVESKLDPGRGAVVTILVQRGTLKVGDALVAGAHWGRVRAMHDYKGEKIKQATPGQPVEVLGFDSVPEAGEFVRVVDNDRKARALAQETATRLKSEQLARRSTKKVSLENIFDRERGATVQELNLVLKADVSGSLEAFEDEIARLPQDEVTVNVIHTGVGGITESDVMLASASDAVVLGFNVRPVGDARAQADREGVEIRTYAVIYKAIDELRDAMQGLLAPEEVEETVGQAEVRATFRASRVGVIAGCYVTSGRMTRGARVRLVRDGTVVYDGEVASLRRFNEDVREVATGFECGVLLRDFMDVKEGDVLEVYETRQVERQLA